jgi:hypothetical protein
MKALFVKDELEIPLTCSEVGIVEYAEIRNL